MAVYNNGQQWWQPVVSPPKPNTNPGGNSGRPPTQHMGPPGANPGGQNAQGSIKNPWKGGQPNTSMYFQYGDNQWGYIDPNRKNAAGDPLLRLGGIKAPGQGYKGYIGNWAQVNKWLQSRGISPPNSRGSVTQAYKDSQYYEQMAPLLADYNRNLLDVQQQLGDMKYQYGRQNKDLTKSFRKQMAEMNAMFSDSGLTAGGGESGMVNKSVLDANEQLRGAKADLERTTGSFAQRNLADLKDQLKSGLTMQEAALLGSARGRYLFMHDNKAPTVKGEGWSKRGQYWFFTDKNGVKVSMGTEGPGAMLQKRMQQAKASGNMDLYKKLQQKYQNTMSKYK